MSEADLQTIPPEPAPQPAELVAPAPMPEALPPVSSEPVQSTPTIQPPIVPSPKSFLSKALEAIQFRKKAKLEKIMKLAQERRSITNDQVEKLLHVSDATATRYLSELVKQRRLKQSGIRGSARYEPTTQSVL